MAVLGIAQFDGADLVKANAKATTAKPSMANPKARC
jgi:hypothetical protein